MHPNETAIHDYVDDALDAPERGEIERHLAACAVCRQLIDDLREIRRVAASLEPRDPPVRAWTRLERAIRLEQAAHTASRRGAAQKRGMRSFLWLAAAAAIIIATIVGLRMKPGTPQPAAPPTAVNAPATTAAASADDAARSVETELRQAEDHYEKAIKGLEQIAAAEQSVFDPRTAATLQKNLAVIDQAIGESRAALRSEPSNEPAQQSLLENFKAKMGLLQDTVALINEMRKGNDAGAARVVSGLKQRGD
jgi:anti-sigma-K factor RskA